ncbi:EXS-domain-containing protein [Piedraia hortae CBS 480.64]|uniref:EXS-domain-containing protein n=1 Tax=Piedraia hortae CBS 480.64 TaxID=1314780 RepID=A0A6A7C941_9PEZI|nr:EXS-domain-containing protein [Piedraia hortae CBS 480.64]
MADIDGRVEEVDAFGLVLPLPYRLAAIWVFGIWLWGLNLYGLNRVQINALQTIRYHSSSAEHVAVFRFATVLTAPLTASLLLFWLFTHGGNAQLVEAYEALANLTLIALLVLIFFVPQRWLWPARLWPDSGRSRLLSTFKRISIGGIAKTEDGKFGDILLADALTSYARPLSELYIVFSMMLLKRPTTGKIDRSSSVMVPILLAVPFMIRFRQCMTDGQTANALKYATAFPAIALSTFMRAKDPLLGHEMLHMLWILAATTNALYSFYWDVARDWDLTLFSHKRQSIDYPYGLRRVRCFNDPRRYYAMICLDLLLRFAWAFKLSPHLEHYYDFEGGIFLLEVMEVLRRFLWVFFRVETEWVRTKHSDEIIIGDMGVKLDQAN